MNSALEFLLPKFPAFDPSKSAAWRNAWLDGFERILYIVDSERRSRLATRQLRTIPKLLPETLSPSDRDDVLQEIAVWLLESTYPKVDLPALVASTVRHVRREYDLRYRTVSLDAPIGEGATTFADLLEG